MFGLRLPRASRSVALLDYAHEIATEKHLPAFKSTRNKIEEKFEYTDVPFQYDPDDYYYYPGLTRPWDVGFLTPVFFNRTVLTKYDADPRYLIRYASPTYGDIRYMDEFSFPFGINRHGHLIMWLGDIAKLPKAEQYYLMSENRPSDHSLGSEFYDGQIECKFTDPPRENLLFAARSDFLAAGFMRWGEKLAHLETEVRPEMRNPLRTFGSANRLSGTMEGSRTAARTNDRARLKFIAQHFTVTCCLG